MLQWIPGSASKILWNDRRGDGYVCRILDVESGRKRTIDSAIYALSADGRTAVTADFRRINDVRPGYGYVSRHFHAHRSLLAVGGGLRITVASSVISRGACPVFGSCISLATSQTTRWSARPIA